MVDFGTMTTPRFVLRPLTSRDATERYSGWFDEPRAASYIAAARHAHDVKALRRFIEERCGRDDVLFLGIFLPDGMHIGNIKYEPVVDEQGYAVMGILIGDPTWRGKGVADEVIAASARWLQRHRRIRQILLGVATDNRAAITAYGKIGFVEQMTPYIPARSDTISMVWNLSA